MPLADIIHAVTTAPVCLMKMGRKIGLLQSGMQADVTIFKIEERKHVHLDFAQVPYEANKLIVPVMTIKNGFINFCSADFALY